MDPENFSGIFAAGELGQLVEFTGVSCVGGVCCLQVFLLRVYFYSLNDAVKNQTILIIFGFSTYEVNFTPEKIII